MSYHVKKKFAEKLNDPEKCRENLKKAYHDHIHLILGKAVWEDDGTLFWKSDAELSKWAIEPSQATEVGALAGMQRAPAAALPNTSQFANLPNTSVLHSGYPPVIVLSVALLSTVYLAYDKIIDPGLAVLFGAFGLVLFFGPSIIERLAKLLPLGGMINQDKEKTISELFKIAHDTFRSVTIASKNEGKYEHSGDLSQDPLTIAKLRKISLLSNLYREIFLRSEREWYQRELIEEATSVRMANGGGTPTSDMPG